MVRKNKFQCACGHSLAYHHLEEGVCHARMREAKTHCDEKDWDGPYAFNRVFTYEDVDCRCQQYIGKTPKTLADKTQ